MNLELIGATNVETYNLLAMRGEKEVFDPLATALHFSREEGRAL